ncbi:MAG: GNAT family N-acetyltransferase [Gammaproteobacteria bacterium]|nr:GNAT family N-acetyltransferase [Gammaproteobacteria bacterium]
MGITAPFPISDSVVIDTFDCGTQSLNEFLIKKARKNEGNEASRTFVVCANNQVIGYYTLATGSALRSTAPGKVRRNIPDPVPVIVIGRLAVDERWQGKSLGVGLLKDAIKRSIGISQQVGVRAIMVHALPEAISFYERWDFVSSPTNETTLFLRVNDAISILAHQ